MRKLILLALLILITLPMSIALEECEPIQETEGIPCQITSVWEYDTPCNSHNATVYNSDGSNIINYTYADFGDSGRCYFTWNVSTSGSYTGTVDNGDTFNITVGVDNLQIALVIAIGITITALLFIAFKLSNDHFILQLGLVFFSVILISLIPAVLIIDTANVIFHRVIMGFIIVFWLYVGTYLVYWILRKAGMIATSSEQ